jgi:hypothetical protein
VLERDFELQGLALEVLQAGALPVPERRHWLVRLELQLVRLPRLRLVGLLALDLAREAPGRL